MATADARNQIAFERQRQLRPVTADARRGGLIDAVAMGFQRQCQTEGRRFAIEKAVAQIQRRPCQASWLRSVKARDGLDVVGRERRSDLDAEIVDRHELELELLAEGLVAAAVLGKTPGGLGSGIRARRARRHPCRS